MLRRHRARALVMLPAALLVFASIAVAKVTAPRHFVGSTSQGKAVDMKVSKNGKKVTLKIGYDVVCPKLQVAFSPGAKFAMKLSKAGKFTSSWTFTTDLQDDPSIGAGNLTGDVHGNTSGKVGTKKATGRYTEHLTMKDGNGQIIDECDSGVIKLSARAVR